VSRRRKRRQSAAEPKLEAVGSSALFGPAAPGTTAYGAPAASPHGRHTDHGTTSRAQPHGPNRASWVWGTGRVHARGPHRPCPMGGRRVRTGAWLTAPPCCSPGETPAHALRRRPCVVRADTRHADTSARPVTAARSRWPATRSYRPLPAKRRPARRPPARCGAPASERRDGRAGTPGTWAEPGGVPRAALRRRGAPRYALRSRGTPPTLRQQRPAVPRCLALGSAGACCPQGARLARTPARSDGTGGWRARRRAHRMWDAISPARVPCGHVRSVRAGSDGPAGPPTCHRHPPCEPER
jgi:hypothetical protein